MVLAKKSADIGMKRGRTLANLPQTKQLDVIAEGLPILMKSADNLLQASKALDQYDRAATILRGHASEEPAKVLILMDIVRCPQKLRVQRVGPMMGWFYDHLARLIYLDAQDWKPTNARELQDYVDRHRKSHYLEGYAGEYIMPNWTTWSRESLLYADMVTYEDGELFWQSPEAAMPPWGELGPRQLCIALRDVGAFTREGLDVTSSVWSQTEFKDTQHWSDTERLTREMLLALDKAKLITEAAHEDQLRILYNHWQLPMYWIDFKPLPVSLEDLRAEQEGSLWNEIGGSH
jgi:hypothetical protein